MANHETKTFDSGEELRKAAELRCRRRLTEDEWSIVDPYDDRIGPKPFTATDLNELVALINTTLPTGKLSKKQRMRRQMRVFDERTARRAQGFVEKQRQYLFGTATPPCLNSAEAEAWLGANKAPNEPQFTTINVTAVVSNAVDFHDSLEAAGRLIVKANEHRKSGNRISQESFNKHNGEHLHEVGRPNPVITYFKHDDFGVLLNQRLAWAAPPNTTMGDLYEEVEELVRKTGWPDYACTHHLLTGQLMSSLENVLTGQPIEKGSLGMRKVALDIYQPARAGGNFSTEVVMTTGGNPSTYHRFGRRRGERARSLSGDVLIQFVDERLRKVPWKEIHMEWNEGPDNRLYKSPDTLRKAYQRAKTRMRSDR